MTTRLYFLKMHAETNLCVQVHELPQNHCSDEREAHVYYTIIYTDYQFAYICILYYIHYILHTYCIYIYEIHITYILYIYVYR